jgi:hypothetical protein
LTAAKKYGVPETTLRDRVSGRVDIDCCNMGKSPILSLDEENKLVPQPRTVIVLDLPVVILCG